MITTDRPDIPVNAIIVAAVARNKYLITLCFHRNSLNFRENILISATRRYEKRKVIANNVHGLSKKLLNWVEGYSNTVTDIEPINIALAGVGSPIKLSVCLLSVLNLASLIPEKTLIIKGVNNHMYFCAFP